MGKDNLSKCRNGEKLEFQDYLSLELRNYMILTCNLRFVEIPWDYKIHWKSYAKKLCHLDSVQYQRYLYLHFEWQHTRRLLIFFWFEFQEFTYLELKNTLFKAFYIFHLNVNSSCILQMLLCYESYELISLDHFPKTELFDFHSIFLSSQFLAFSDVLFRWRNFLLKSKTWLRGLNMKMLTKP